MKKCKAYDDGAVLGTVEGKIHSVVEAMRSDVGYRFMNWAQANEVLEDFMTEKPTILYVLPPSGRMDVSWREVKDSPSTIIAFLSSTELDFSGHRNDNVIERMKRLFVEFVKAYNKSGLFDEIEGSVPYQVIYDKLDVNVTGIAVTLTIAEKQGISLCGEELRLDPEDEEETDEAEPEDEDPDKTESGEPDESEDQPEDQTDNAGE